MKLCYVDEIGFYKDRVEDIRFIYPNSFKVVFPFHALIFNYKWDVNAYLEFMRVSKECGFYV